MTQKLDHAIAAVRRLSQERQDELADVLEAAAAEAGGHTPEELAAIDEGLADAEVGRFAELADIQAVFERHRSGMKLRFAVLRDLANIAGFSSRTRADRGWRWAANPFGA